MNSAPVTSALDLLRFVRSIPLDIMLPSKRVFRVDSATRSVLFVLISRGAGGQGSCFPSLNTLSVESGSSVRTVMRRLSLLEQAGIVVRKRRRDTSTVYKINCNVVTKFSTDLSTHFPQPRSE